MPQSPSRSDDLSSFCATLPQRNHAALAICLIALTACVRHGEQPEDAPNREIIERSRHVDGRMLPVEDENRAYKTGAHESFRGPNARHDPTPQLPADSSRTNLEPTTVCVRLIISEQGDVERVDPLDDRDECHAGVASMNADLLQAVSQQLLDWKFEPAAICTWPEGRHPSVFGGCTGAEQVRPVPVSLFYAFTFEIREGRRLVRQGR